MVKFYEKKTDKRIINEFCAKGKTLISRYSIAPSVNLWKSHEQKLIAIPSLGRRYIVQRDVTQCGLEIACEYCSLGTVTLLHVYDLFPDYLTDLARANHKPYC